MKHSEFVKYLTAEGCYLQRHGGGHDMWCNPKNGRTAPVPRHSSKEIPLGTAKNIIRLLEL